MKSKKFQQSFTKLINLWSHFATSRGLFQITSNRHYAIKILINSFLSICYFRKENTEAVHVEFICWIIFNCSRGKGTSTHTQASPGRSCGWCSNQSIRTVSSDHLPHKQQKPLHKDSEMGWGRGVSLIRRTRRDAARHQHWASNHRAGTTANLYLDLGHETRKGRN